MAGAPPDADPAPSDGGIPPDVLAGREGVDLGLYLHVPFCTTRCGYCDFNTYTAAELGGSSGQVSLANLADLLVAEMELAGRVLGPTAREVSTVFLGGGTPTLLDPGDVARVLRRVQEILGLAPGAEVTIEANPDSVDPQRLAGLRAAGCTRLSFGMQSASPAVLATLERTHRQGAVGRAVAWARQEGFDAVSVDLIYGTPGESLSEWEATVDSALDLDVGHISAYALIVEEGTKLANAVHRGALAPPEDDLMADMYQAADERFMACGLSWYELSNWARPGQQCRHNLGYWQDADWWGVGPGAHSHIGGLRWWNLRHPGAWARELRQGRSPAQSREQVSPAGRELERVMLTSRLATGLELRSAAQVSAGHDLCTEGLATWHPPTQPGEAPRIQLTLRGRLLADAVVHRLT